MRSFRDECAQALVLIALSTAGLLLGVGLAVDAGQLYVARRAAQNAVDAAAWAGAVELYKGNGPAVAETAAIDDAARNGYTLLPADVDSPPTSGPTAGDASFIEVRLSLSVSTFFFPGPRTVSVRAVGGSARAGSGEAVLVLRTGSTARTLEINDSAAMTVSGSGIYVNSSHADAVDIAGGGVRITSPYTRVVGGVNNGDEAQISPAANETYGPALADPFLGLPAPSTAGLGAPQTVAEVSSGTVTLTPGIYDGGLSVRGGVLRLDPGIYVLRGGGFGLRVRQSGRLEMSSATGGVLIFLTYANYPAAPGGSPDCDRLSIIPEVAGAATLRAQSTGTYAGIVVYEDRACPAGIERSEFDDVGPRSVSGTIYLPRSQLIVRGGTTLTWSAQLVVRELLLEENGTLLQLTFDPGRVLGARAPALTE